MKASRWAVMSLLLVVCGGAILAADTVFDLTVSTGDYTAPFGLSGLAFLSAGIASLVEAADGRRTRVIGWFGAAIGLALILVVDGFVAAGPFVYYGGIAVLVITGVVFFLVHFDSNQQNAT